MSITPRGFSSAWEPFLPSPTPDTVLHSVTEYAFLDFYVNGKYSVYNFLSAFSPHSYIEIQAGCCMSQLFLPLC